MSANGDIYTDANGAVHGPLGIISAQGIPITSPKLDKDTSGREELKDGIYQFILWQLVYLKRNYFKPNNNDEIVNKLLESRANNIANVIDERITAELTAIRDELLAESKHMRNQMKDGGVSVITKNAVDVEAINQVFERHGVK